LVAVAALLLGADYALNALDVNLPLRQLMFGRNLHVLAVHGRFVCSVVRSYVAARRARDIIEPRICTPSTAHGRVCQMGHCGV
jgi:hypothetical protein